MNAVLPPTEARTPPVLKPVPSPAAGQDASRPEARTLAGRGPECLPAWSPYPRRPQAGMPPAEVPCSSFHRAAWHGGGCV